SGALVIPRFVLDELQRLADSAESQKAIRGKRGLEMMEKMRATEGLNISIHEEPIGTGQEQPVDNRLVTTARELNARLLTNDENLAKTARLRGITVLNFNDLAVALQPQLN